MQALHVELLVALEIDEAHRRAGCRFRESLGVPIVILLRLHVRPTILWRHQPHIVTLLAKQAAKMMGAAACFHRHDAARHS